MSYENRIREIDHDYDKIKDFNKDLLLSNIYHFWCFANYLSMQYIWRRTALHHLKVNLKKKWILDLPNVNHIEIVERKTETLNPIIFYDDSESYFQKLFLMKSDLEKLIKPHHLIKLYCIFKKTYYIIFLFLSNIVVVVVIMSSLQKYEYFFPRKVYPL